MSRTKQISHFALTLAIALADAGCESKAPKNPSIPDVVADAGDHAGADANGDIADAGIGGECRAEPLRKGMQWVRENPMLISGLIPGLQAPGQEGADDYFDVFGANAVHLWANGLPTIMDGWSSLDIENFRWISWVRADGTSWDGGEVLGGYSANPPGRIGYQIGDEPRSWDEYHEMVEGIAATKAVDPEGLHYINFSHYPDELDDYLDHYATGDVGDIISYDVYNSDWKTHRRIAPFRKAGATYGIPNWCYINFFSDADNPSFWSETDLRWSTFLHALNGCVGFSYFYYQRSAGSDAVSAGFASDGDYSAEKTSRYFDAAKLNQELAVLGRSLTQLRSVDVRYFSSLITPLGVDDWAAGAGNDPYLHNLETSGSNHELSIGFFVDDDCDVYVMVQNANHPEGTYPTNNDEQTDVTLTFDFGSSPPVDPDAVDVLDKVSGAVDTVPLEDLGSGRSRLTVSLPPGEIFFYKYRTGRPFVQQSL